MGKAVKLPKTKCCVSKDRCSRCPIRMLKDGDLPTGYGVHKRRLVKLDPVTGKPLKKGSGKGRAKVSKAELVAAARKQSGKSNAA